MEVAGTDCETEADLAHNLNNCIVPLSWVNFANVLLISEGRESGGGGDSKIVPLPLKSLSFVTAFLLQPPLPKPSTPRIGQCVQTETAVQMQEPRNITFPACFFFLLLAHIDSSKVWLVSLQHEAIDNPSTPLHPLHGVWCAHLTEQTKCAIEPGHAKINK